MIYEVDNRYPEVARPYEKVRGVRRHGAVPVAIPPAERHAMRINNLKRYFLTATAAMTSVVVLVAGASKYEHEPTPVVEPFREPAIYIESAEADAETAETLTYGYRVELNSAENLEVSASVTTPDGVEVGKDGPFSHQSSGSSSDNRIPLSIDDAPESVMLTLTGFFSEDGITKTVTATQTIPLTGKPFTAPTISITSAELAETGSPSLLYTYEVVLNSAPDMQVTAEATGGGQRLGENGPFVHTLSESSQRLDMKLTPDVYPETVTLTLTGTYSENGETKTVTASQTFSGPERPFTAPTLTITEAVLSDEARPSLTYSYEVELNSAEDLRVTASVTADSGEQLGTDGPFIHTASEASPAHSAPLDWSSFPDTVTLTLTGTYTEKGVTKTVAAETTLSLSFSAPTLTIIAASLSPDTVSPLTYAYRVALNSAEELQVSVAVSSDTGEQLSTAGPFAHSESEDSPYRNANLSWSTTPKSVTLTIVGTFVEKGETKTVTASRTLAVPEQPFVAPTLEITAASLTDGTVTPLSYGYTVTLNSAGDLRVSAAVTTGSGEAVGSDGPFTHTASEASPSRSVPLSWSVYPETLTLTLTGTYTEKGETKTITASRTLAVPELPFVAPTLEITAASLADGTVTPLTYGYSVTLNSAGDLRVSAAVTTGSGEAVGSDGPFTHTASEASPSHSVPLSWSVYPETLTLTLTGTYTEKGETKTITASRTLAVPELPFVAPTLEITAASLADGTVTPLTYGYSVTLNSAGDLRVSAAVTTGSGEAVGSDGPFTHTASEASPSHSVPLSWSAYPETLTLTLTGTYTEKGETKTVTVSRNLPVPELPFTAPTLEIIGLSHPSDMISPLTYAYSVTLNSAENLSVVMTVTSNTGEQISSDGPFLHESSGDSPYRNANLSWSTYPEKVTLTLTGTYTEKGVTKTVTASRTLETPPAFVAPSFEDVTLSINDIEEWASVFLTYHYKLNIGDASQVTVTMTATSDLGDIVCSDGANIHSVTETYDAYELHMTMVTETEKSVTMLLTGVYEENGVEKTITEEKTVNLYLAPDLFDSGGEVYGQVGNPTIHIGYWAEFWPKAYDDHADSYVFEVTRFTVYWYNGSYDEIGMQDAGDPSAFTITKATDHYRFDYTGGVTDFPADAVYCYITIIITDTTTGHSYSTFVEIPVVITT